MPETFLGEGLINWIWHAEHQDPGAVAGDDTLSRRNLLRVNSYRLGGDRCGDQGIKRRSPTSSAPDCKTSTVRWDAVNRVLNTIKVSSKTPIYPPGGDQPRARRGRCGSRILQRDPGSGQSECC